MKIKRALPHITLAETHNPSRLMLCDDRLVKVSSRTRPADNISSEQDPAHSVEVIFLSMTTHYPAATYQIKP